MQRPSAEQQTITPEIIAITSQHGGVGNSTTALNLAVALVAAGRSVLLIDLDPQGQTGSSLMSGIHTGGAEHMLREATLTRDMMTATEIPDLYLVSAGPGLSGIERELSLLGDSRTRLHQALATLSALPLRFDHIVIDCPPSLGLLTLNALAAAHHILMPMPCEFFALAGLPTRLESIARLRAGLKQPLRGIHLLITHRTPSDSARTLIKRLRRDYGQLVLQTEIPHDAAVSEAAERGLPLLVHCLYCDASQVYLELATEWLLKHDTSQHTPRGWSFRAGQTRRARERKAMCQRIQAWLIDPSSLLYDATWEAKHRRDVLVFDELFRTQLPHKRSRTLRPLLLLLFLSAASLFYLQTADAPWWSEWRTRLVETDFTSLTRSWSSAEDAPPVALELSPAPTVEPVEAEPLIEPEPELPPEPQVEPVELEPLIEPALQPEPPSEPIEVEPLIEPELPPEQASEPVEVEPLIEPALPPEPPREPVEVEPLIEPELPPEQAAEPVAVEPLIEPELPPEQTVEPVELVPPDETVPLKIPVEPRSGYRWHVQVLAGRSLERVKSDSEHFMRAHASLLNDRKVVISQTHHGDTRDNFYRLSVMEWESWRTARDWCARLRARGQQCLVIRVIPEEVLVTSSTAIN